MGFELISLSLHHVMGSCILPIWLHNGLWWWTLLVLCPISSCRFTVPVCLSSLCQGTFLPVAHTGNSSLEDSLRLRSCLSVYAESQW